MSKQTTFTNPEANTEFTIKLDFIDELEPQFQLNIKAEHCENLTIWQTNMTSNLPSDMDSKTIQILDLNRIYEIFDEYASNKLNPAITLSFVHPQENSKENVEPIHIKIITQSVHGVAYTDTKTITLNHIHVDSIDRCYRLYEKLRQQFNVIANPEDLNNLNSLMVAVKNHVNEFEKLKKDLAESCDEYITDTITDYIQDTNNKIDKKINELSLCDEDVERAIETFMQNAKRKVDKHLSELNVSILSDVNKKLVAFESQMEHNYCNIDTARKFRTDIDQMNTSITTMTEHANEQYRYKMVNLIHSKNSETQEKLTLLQDKLDNANILITSQGNEIAELKRQFLDFRDAIDGSCKNIKSMHDQITNVVPITPSKKMPARKPHFL